MHERKKQRERKRERDRIGEIVSSKLVKYTKDVDGGFNTVFIATARGNKEEVILAISKILP